MVGRAVLAASALVLVVLFVPAASADCVTQGGPVGVQVCEDENGNGTPDRLRLWTPVADVEHDEDNCRDCASDTEVGAGASGFRATGEVHCALTSDPACTAGDVKVRGHGVVVAVWFFTTDGDGDDRDDGDDEGRETWVCVKVGAPGTGVLKCRIIHEE